MLTSLAFNSLGQNLTGRQTVSQTSKREYAQGNEATLHRLVTSHRKMPVNSISQIVRRTTLVLASALASVSVPAQLTPGPSQLPATAPTTATAPNTLPPPIAATQVPKADAVPRQRAKVTYSAGLLRVEANNSSLNGILRDIATATGMKITGGVMDQRVFGNYGPAEPSTILATLLDGTGSNMLIQETAGNAPKELILTPRGGGPSPPSPSNFNGDVDLSGDAEAIPPNPPPPAVTDPDNVPAQAAQQQPAQSGPQPIPQPLNNVLGSSNNTTPTASSIPSVQSISTDSLSTPSTAQPASGIVDSTNPPPAGSTGGNTGFGSATPTQPAADSPKTPQQIYEQLQALRQASQQQQQGSGSSNTTTQPSSTTPH